MFMGFGLIFTVLLVAVFAYAVGWRPQESSNLFTPASRVGSPLDIAKARYARGEISKEEFAQIRVDLTN